MKKSIFKLLIISTLFPILCCNACTSQSEPVSESEGETYEKGSGEVDGYKLVWQDLFNESKLNTDNWNIEVNAQGGGNAELQFYRAENVSMGKEPVTGKSCLVLTARRENIANKNATSGRVNTLDIRSFRYGKIEASIKPPKTANGLWPAFWMMGADYSTVGWPRCGEIDILEMGSSEGISKEAQEVFHGGCCHWGGDWNGGSYPNYARGVSNDYSLQDDFHLYTLIWDESSIRMYLDLDKYPGVEPYYQMSIDGFDSDSSPGYYFNKPFFILLNLAVGGNFTQIWDINKVTALNEENNFEAKMYIDYVKVYQKEIVEKD